MTCENETVAVLLARNGIIPPKEYEHDPLKCNYNKNTVALYLAKNNIIPPK